VARGVSWAIAVATSSPAAMGRGNPHGGREAFVPPLNASVDPYTL